MLEVIIVCWCNVHLLSLILVLISWCLSKRMLEPESEQGSNVELAETPGSDVPEKRTPFNCESCSEAFKMEQLFQCTTCVNKLESTDAVTFNCELCIGSHVRKGHDVLDHKSLSPAICESHKNLCSVFCTICDEILCVNCLSKHQNHNVMTIKEKASKVRPKVFESLSNLDSREKVVRGTMERIKEKKEERTKDFDKLVLDISAELDAAKEKILDCVRSKHEKTVNLETESTENYENLLRCQSDLRELLSCSEGNLVRNFETKEKQVDQVNSKQTELELCQIEGVNYSISENTSQAITKFCEDFLSTVEVPQVMARKCCYVYSTCDGTLYNVECEGNKTTVYECHFEEYADDVRMTKINLATNEHDFWIIDLNAFYIMQKNAFPSILIKTGNFVQLFDIKKKVFRVINLSLPPHHVPLCFVAFNLDKAEFVYWDQLSRVVRQTDNKSIEYKCETLPRVVNSWHDGTYVHLVNQENDIVEIATNRTSKTGVYVIKSNIHCVNHINSISHINKTLVIWSLPTDTLTIFCKNNEDGEYFIINSVLYESKFSYFCVPRSYSFECNWRFLVSAKTQDENRQCVENHVFMIKKS